MNLAVGARVTDRDVGVLIHLCGDRLESDRGPTRADLHVDTGVLPARHERSGHRFEVGIHPVFLVPQELVETAVLGFRVPVRLNDDRRGAGLRQIDRADLEVG